VDDADTPADTQDDRWTSFTTADGLLHNTVHAIVIDADGAKWIATDGGISYLDDAKTPNDKDRRSMGVVYIQRRIGR